MTQWKSYVSNLMQRVGEFGKLAPEAMNGLHALGSIPARHLDPSVVFYK